jgi:hypothetical protein
MSETPLVQFNQREVDGLVAALLDRNEMIADGKNDLAAAYWAGIEAQYKPFYGDERYQELLRRSGEQFSETLAALESLGK